MTVQEFRQRHALVFIDLDRFKAVNDSAGHAAGDALLREISSLMLSMLRSTDILARLGGDEFGLLLPDATLRAHGILPGALLNPSTSIALYGKGASTVLAPVPASPSLMTPIIN